MSNTKTKILDSAERLFAEHGLDGASLRAITAAAGANLGSIHYYFGSKTNLIRDVLQRRVDQFNEKRSEEFAKLMSTKNGEPDIKDIWLTLTRVIFDFKSRYPDFARFFGQINMIDSDELRDLMAEVAIDFESSFFEENMVQFADYPKEIRDEVTKQCILFMHLIYLASINQQALTYDCQDHGLELTEEQLIHMLAELATNTLENLKK